MIVLRTVDEVREFVRGARERGATVGFVPTMGYFHEGHLALMRRAREENGVAVASLYVNPMQFAPTEDLASYPRDFERDRAMAEAAGVDALFAPGDDEMYPDRERGAKGGAAVRLQPTSVSVAGLNAILEGRFRPTHFDGVATVVLKLFNIVLPDRAYFGQKDYQQCVVVRTMARDLNVPVEIRVVPTVREPDGLAMSSRNVYLMPAERRAAPILHRTLLEAASMVQGGERDGRRVAEFMRRRISGEPLASLDYAEVVDAETLEPVSRIDGRVLLAVACRFGRARLIDNELCSPPDSPPRPA